MQQNHRIVELATFSPNHIALQVITPQTIFVTTVPSNIKVSATSILIRWHYSDNGAVVHTVVLK